MNKLGFISGLISILLVLFQFIPLGIYFGVEGSFSNWPIAFFGIKNPIINAYSTLPLNLFTYENINIYLWGISVNGTLFSWLEVNLLSFIFLFLLSIVSAIVTFIGCKKETKSGKKLMNVNLIILIFVFLFSIIGIPVYSQEILGTQFGYFDIFLYLNYGFYLLLINILIALTAYIKHPLQ